MVTSRGHRAEKGQVLVLFTIIFIFVVLPLMAWVIDQGFLYHSRRTLQKVVDSACLAGAIAIQNSTDRADRTSNAQDAIIASLTDHDVDSAAYTPNEGTGTGLIKGIEVNGSDVRVRVKRPTTTILSQFLGNPNGWEMAAGAHCETGLGGVLPLAIKEFEGCPDQQHCSPITSTPAQSDSWDSGACEVQHTPYDRDGTGDEPKFRDSDGDGVPSEQDNNCWVWGDWQVLAGQGHVPMEGETSMKGLIVPDIRCQGDPTDPAVNDCNTLPKVYIPPVPSDIAVNPLKDTTQSYIYAGGYDGPLPIPGVYNGVHSSLIAQAEGVSASFTPRPIEDKYDVGDWVLVFVYKDGQLHNGDHNYDYVEVIGYAVVEIKYFNSAPNMVSVAPVYPPPSAAWDTDGNRVNARDFLPETLEEVEDAGFAVYPILIEWD